MTLAFWNVRGCGRKDLSEEVKVFCNMFSICIMVLCESKSKKSPSLASIRACGVVPTIGMSGGMWIMWKEFISNPFVFTLLHKASRFVAYNLKLLIAMFLLLFFSFMPLLEQMVKMSFGWNSLNM